MSHQTALHPSLPALFHSTCHSAVFSGWHFRKNDQWEHMDALELWRRVQCTSLGLRAWGFGVGQGLGIIAPSSPQWIILDIAAQICGGYTVPLFPNISSAHFQFQVQDAPVHWLAIDDLHLPDESLRAQVESFPRLITLAEQANLPAGARSWNALQAEGEKLLESEGDVWIDERMAAIDPHSVFSIIYTSGSTGTPKGVPLTHHSMLVQVQAIAHFFPLSPLDDSALSCLPVAHVFERMAIFYFLHSEIAVWFADDARHLGQYLPEVRPSVITVVPRILERLYEKLASAPSRARGPKKWLLQWAVRVARNTDPAKPCWRRRLLDPLVYRKMREALGNRFKVIVSGSSALNTTVSRFLLNAGFPVFEGYGLTECSPVVTACHPGHQKAGTVGPALAHLEVRLSSDNEVQVRGASVFHGYHNRPDLQADTFTDDGFFRTGDLGTLDADGYLKLTGRKKEMLKTSTGKYVRPVPIELELIRHPLIEQAQVIADNRKFVSALIFLEKENARLLLGKPNAQFDPTKATASRRIQARIAAHIRRVNRGLSEWERIRKWIIVADEPTIESGLLTPTLKLRRKEVEKHYNMQIDSLYETPLG